MGEWFNDLCFDFCTSLGQINRAGHILRAHHQQFRVTKGPLSAPNTFARVHKAKTIVQLLRSISFFHSHFLTSEGGIFHLEEATRKRDDIITLMANGMCAYLLMCFTHFLIFISNIVS